MIDGCSGRGFQAHNKVWGREHVHDNHYLRVYLTALRRKIEDDPSQPRYLLTEQGVGYRLVTELT